MTGFCVFEVNVLNTLEIACPLQSHQLLISTELKIKILGMYFLCSYTHTHTHQLFHLIVKSLDGDSSRLELLLLLRAQRWKGTLVRAHLNLGMTFL